MKKLFLIPSLLFTLTSYAQTVPDSTAVRQLEEVVVEGQTSTTNATVSSYLISKKHKDVARNGYDLLRLTGIPQIQISPTDNKITSLEGSPVAIFVNGMPVAPGEMENMRTSDAIRVEYLDYPSDPRYQGAPHVINFIFKKYEYGGYTRLSTEERFLNTKAFNNSSVFSRFSYKRMMYDLYVSNSYNYSNHYGSNSTEVYRDPISEQQLTRSTRTRESLSKSENLPVSLRIAYNSNKVQIYNILGFNFNSTPTAFDSGLLTTSQSTLPQSFKNENSQITRGYSWIGIYQLALSKGWSMNISPTVIYNFGNTNRGYSSSIIPEGIYYNIREKAVKSGLGINVSKMFPKGHALSFFATGTYNYNQLKYSQTINNTHVSDEGTADIEARYNWANMKFMFSGSIRYFIDHISVNHHGFTDTKPQLSLAFAYSPTNRHRLSLNAGLARSAYGINQYNSQVIQDNEFLSYSGNRDIHPNKAATASLSYLFMPSNLFRGSLNVNYLGMYNRLINLYMPTKEEFGIIRFPVNNGNFHQITTEMNLTLNLLKGDLVITAHPQYVFQQSRGFYRKTKNFFRYNVGAYYTKRSFYAGINYFSPERRMNFNSPAITKIKSHLELYAGWSQKGWNATVAIVNIFRKSYITDIENLDTEYYSSVTETIGTNRHRLISLSISYTFGYGKPIERGGEVRAGEGAGSFIL